MRTNPNVAIAIMFGRGRFQNGVLLHPPNPVNPDNESELIAYRNLVWYVFFSLSSNHGTQSPRRNTIEKANEHAPAHSKIFKEMILVTSPDKPVELTAKGTPRRQAALNAYAREIEDLYEKVKDASQTDVKSPAEWTEDTTLEFVREAVGRVMRDPVEDEDDLFQFGCDRFVLTFPLVTSR